MKEPTIEGTRVLDREGDTWRRGRTRWTCEALVDGGRVSAVGRLAWPDLDRMYGPLEVIA